MGSGLYEWRGWKYGPNFLFGGQLYEEFVFGLRGLCFGEYFEINVEDGCMISMQSSMHFGYQVAICPSLGT
jgi:hypothetical protein